jgi:hypothetical protein
VRNSVTGVRFELMVQNISTRDARYPIGHGHGSDAIHRDPIYSYAVTQLQDDQGRIGVGFAFTLGEGNQLVCADTWNFIPTSQNRRETGVPERGDSGRERINLISEFVVLVALEVQLRKTRKMFLIFAGEGNNERAHE